MSLRFFGARRRARDLGNQYTVGKLSTRAIFLCKKRSQNVKETAVTGPEARPKHESARGGLQSDGMKAAQARQLHMSEKALQEFGEGPFAWAKPFGKGRLSAPRIRMQVDQRALVCDRLSAAKAIEQHVRSSSRR